MYDSEIFSAYSITYLTRTTSTWIYIRFKGDPIPLDLPFIETVPTYRTTVCGVGRMVTCFSTGNSGTSDITILKTETSNSYDHT